jgi:RNA polymerase sigma-70 factor (ECF subfamily)
MNPPRSDKPNSHQAPRASGKDRRASDDGRGSEASLPGHAEGDEEDRSENPKDGAEQEQNLFAENGDGADEEEPGNSQHSMEDRVHEDMASAGTVSPAWSGLGQQIEAPARTAATGRMALPVDDGSDAAIMLRVRDGDTSGFTYLIEKHRKQIVHYMYRMTGNLAVAEELAQEVFLRVYRSRESYRAEAKFTTWLYRIATNLGVNYARDHRHERAAQSVYLDQPDAETGTTPDVADSRHTVEQELLRKERMSGIRAQVMSLPERQRQAVLMHKYQEMDYREIGAVLKLSESATKSLLFRAYQTLRERLKDYV